MDVQDPKRETRDEGRREDAHETGEADEIGPRRLEAPASSPPRARRAFAPRPALDEPPRSPIARAFSRPGGVGAVGDDRGRSGPEALPRAHASASASKFEPRPDRRTARRAGSGNVGDGRREDGRRTSAPLTRSGRRAPLSDDPPDLGSTPRPPRRADASPRPGAAGGTKRTMPMPQLKTRSISSGATRPFSCEEPEERRPAPRAAGSTDGVEARREDAREVVGKAAAGDVRHGAREGHPPRAAGRG